MSEVSDEVILQKYCFRGTTRRQFWYGLVFYYGEKCNNRKDDDDGRCVPAADGMGSTAFTRKGVATGINGSAVDSSFSPHSLSSSSITPPPPRHAAPHDELLGWKGRYVDLKTLPKLEAVAAQRRQQQRSGSGSGSGSDSGSGSGSGSGAAAVAAQGQGQRQWRRRR